MVENLTNILTTNELPAPASTTARTPPDLTRLKEGLQKNQALNTALSTVQPERLRCIVKNLCLISNTAEEYIAHILLTPEEDASPKSKRKRKWSAPDDTREAEKGRNKKFKPRYTMCVQCDEEFDVTLNVRGACRYHPGSREADYQADVWADHDENCHGRISDLEDEFPEGFQWTCCERAGNMGGCKKGVHRDEVMEVDEMSDVDVPSGSELDDEDDDEDGSDPEDGGD